MKKIFLKRYPKGIFKNAHKHSIRHQAQILDSKHCGCFYCLKTFKPTDIVEWICEDDPEGGTACCPYCSVDSVLGSAAGFPIDEPDFMIRMKKAYFE